MKVNKQESIRKEESKEGRKEVKQTHKQTIYIVPKSTHESRCITALEPIRGVTSYNGSRDGSRQNGKCIKMQK